MTDHFYPECEKPLPGWDDVLVLGLTNSLVHACLKVYGEEPKESQLVQMVMALASHNLKMEAQLSQLIAKAQPVVTGIIVKSQKGKGND